jgi:hypothetical protein
MTEERRLAYDFMNLPHYLQLRIALGLGLVSQEEVDSKSDTELFTKAFQVARDEKKLPILRAEVSTHMPQTWDKEERSI